VHPKIKIRGSPDNPLLSKLGTPNTSIPANPSSGTKIGSSANTVIPGLVSSSLGVHTERIPEGDTPGARIAAGGHVDGVGEANVSMQTGFLNVFYTLTSNPIVLALIVMAFSIGIVYFLKK
jgi:hypothetical protein